MEAEDGRDTACSFRSRCRRQGLVCIKGRIRLSKKKNAGWLILLVFALTAAALIAAYCIFAVQYETKFIEGTYINGMNVGELTVAEVEQEIKDRVEDYALEITFRGGQKETLAADTIGFAYASDRGVAKLLANQNRYDWLPGKFGASMSYTVSESYTYDPNKLKDAMLALPEFAAANTISPQDAYMRMGEDNRLMIVPEIDGNELREDAVLSALRTAVETGQTSVDLNAVPNAYEAAEVRSDDSELNAQVNDLNTYLDVVVTYNLYDGTQVTLDRSTTAGWLSVQKDDKNYYYFNTDNVQAQCGEFVRKIAEQYNQTYDSVTFHSTNRGDIVVPTETRGYLIDEAAEASELYQVLLGRQSAEREPVYSLNKTPLSDFGGTYIEIDIANQHVYFYVDGQIYVDTPCVTGLASDPERRTPTGAFSVIEKDTSRTLRGEIDPSTGRPSYESFVNYWMRIFQGVGLHDASWRSSFGGNIYQGSGSHGCINLPYDAAKAIYEKCEEGTPAIVI